MNCLDEPRLLRSGLVLRIRGTGAEKDPVEAAGRPASRRQRALGCWCGRVRGRCNNWQEGKDLLPEVVLRRVKSGDYWFKVVPVAPDTFKQNYSRKFGGASEANAGKYDIDVATRGLKDVTTGKMPDFYFGYPFPKIDPKDSNAACKMAWNFTAAADFFTLHHLSHMSD